MKILSFTQFINESYLSPANLGEFISYHGFVPTDTEGLEPESVEILREIDQKILEHLGSNEEGVIQLDTQWRYEEPDNLDENSEWMKMGNFPELFYQAGDQDSHVWDEGFEIGVAGTVRKEFLYGEGEVIGEEIGWPLYRFSWRGHPVCLLRSLEDTMEWLFMRKEDFAREAIG